MRLGIFLPNWIGDVVMATPALDSLRELAGQNGHVVGVMRPYVADVVEGLGLFDRTILYKPKAKDPELSSKAVIRSLREEELDAIVLLTNSIRTGWLAWRSGAKERIGYSRDARRLMLTTRLTEPVRFGKRSPLPQIDSYLNLAYAAGGEWRAPTLKLDTTEEDRHRADQVWDKLGLPDDEKTIVFNTGGAYGDAKSWPKEKFAALAKRIVSETDYNVLVNCGPAERETAREIVSLSESPRVGSLADFDSPIGLSKEVIRRSRLLVTTDSGPRFFGIAFGKPVVSIFGPTDPSVTRTHYDKETQVSLSLDCQYCWERSCPLGHHNCMQQLDVSQIYRAVMKSLDSDNHEAAVDLPKRSVA